jgi:hypothetical protein
MKFKQALSILLFSLGLVMLVLRPFSVVQLVKQQGTEHPRQIGALLQRLVTKKDEHLYLTEVEVAALPDDKVKIRRPMQVLVFLSRYLFPLHSLLVDKHPHHYTTVFQICPENNYYKRLSRFQI